MFGGWLNSSVAMVTWTNRSSDAAVYCLYSESSSWQCTPIYTQTSPLTPGWIELVCVCVCVCVSRSVFVLGHGPQRLEVKLRTITGSFDHTYQSTCMHALYTIPSLDIMCSPEL